MESKKSSITAVDAYECLDSRGFPTIAAIIELADGTTSQSMVPSGASTGEFEALELRDGDKQRYLGKGVLTAVENIKKKIGPSLIGQDVLELAALDRKMLELDGTENKSKLGANSILGVSLAAAHAGANFLKIPLFRYLGGPNARKLPIPLVNVINGGAHAANSLDFQEFMIVPQASVTFFENIRIASEVFHTLKKNLTKKGLSTSVGDEGGFAPNFSSQDQALDVLVEAIGDAGYSVGDQVAIALDCAASELFDDETGKYTFKKGNKESYTSAQLVELYASWLDKYPIVSIEDGLDENDWDGWKHMTAEIGDQVQLIGDDLFVTNVKRLSRGIAEGSANSILIKLNQIGTVTETLETIRMAQEAGFTSVISHRSGETEDSTIADLCVATGAGQIKTGSVCRSERTAKYNRLLWIESMLRGEGYCQSPFRGAF